MAKTGSKPPWPDIPGPLGPGSREGSEQRPEWEWSQGNRQGLRQQQDPRNRTLGEMRPHQPGSGPGNRFGPHTCPECHGKFLFPKMVDEGHGDIQRHCPICGAELGRIKRKRYIAERERWRQRTARFFQTSGKDADELSGTETPAKSPEPQTDE